MALYGNIPDEPNEPEYEQSRLERIKEYIAANVSSDLSASTVSRTFELSVSTLLHIFKQHEQQTYQHYLEQTRMKKAMELIKGGKWVKEVMHATGYKNRGTFYNAFKRKYQLPPRHFQK